MRAGGRLLPEVVLVECSTWARRPAGSLRLCAPWAWGPCAQEPEYGGMASRICPVHWPEAFRIGYRRICSVGQQ